MASLTKTLYKEGQSGPMIEFLDLGMQPIANNFADTADKDEYKYNLSVGFDPDTCLVSLMNKVDPKKMFNDSYEYRSSMSNTMQQHFENIAVRISVLFNPRKVLEIGSNDGVFIKHFNPQDVVAIEPCGNMVDVTTKMGFTTYKNFWSKDVANKLKNVHGEFDVVYAANCMCHIHDLSDAFSGVADALSDDGVFIFEDPSLASTVENVAYDQFYDEHQHIFSVTALYNLLLKEGLEIYGVEKLSVHGGSNRIFCQKIGGNRSGNIIPTLIEESKQGLAKLSTYKDFAESVIQSKDDLLTILKAYKDIGHKVICYGATSKTTTIFNYCGIGTDLIEYITDTTPNKQGKVSPGMHIPIVSPEEGFTDDVDIAFLGAWNFQKEIMAKEQAFLERGGSFITHVPYTRVVK